MLTVTDVDDDWLLDVWSSNWRDGVVNLRLYDDAENAGTIVLTHDEAGRLRDYLTYLLEGGRICIGADS